MLSGVGVEAMPASIERHPLGATASPQGSELCGALAAPQSIARATGTDRGSSLQDMATMAPPAGATNGELIRWSFERLNARDLEALRGLWSAETVERFPQGTYLGTDAIEAAKSRLLGRLRRH